MPTAMQSCLPRCTGCIRETVRVRLTCGTYGQMQAELGRKSRVLSEEEQELALAIDHEVASQTDFLRCATIH